jgi:hypothetical protein
MSNTRSVAATLLLALAGLAVACGSPTAPLPDLVVVTDSLPTAINGQAYQATVEAAGGDGVYTWTRVSGNLPPGVTLTTDEAGRAILSGSVLAAGSFTFTLQVTSGDGQTASRTLTIEVTPALTITTTSLPNANIESTYSAAIQAAGGDGAYFWSLQSGSLPPGLALNVDDLGERDHALVTGVPTEEGTFTFRVEVRSGDGQTASRQFTITVEARLPLAIETPAVPPALVGGPYDVGLEAHGGVGDFAWSVVEGALPNGLQLTAGGRIQGTATTPQTREFTIQVRSGGETDQRSYRIEVVAERTDQYNITLFPVTPIPASIQPHVDSAITEWQQVITSNLPAVALNTAQFDASGCGGFMHLVDGTATDDLIIIVSIEPIDGPGGVLGMAGPCLVRSGEGGLPPLGVVILDSEDLIPRAGDQEVTHIISHEIGHVLGFGTLWNHGGRTLRTGTGTSDPRFVGQSAVQEWRALGGQGDVPVEDQGGSGTRDSHWRKTVFGTERMTGYSSGKNVFQPLSRVSVASFVDLGYAVDLSQADAYSLPAALFWPDDMPHLREILIEPVGIVYPDGRTRPIQPR